MTRKLKTITVQIMEREYPVACPQGEETMLMNAVDYTDRVMKKIKRAGRTVGVERIAVMAALNMAHDLLAIQRDANHTPSIRTEHRDEDAHSTEHQQTLDRNNTFTESELLAQHDDSAIAQQIQALTERLEAAMRDEASAQDSRTQIEEKIDTHEVVTQQEDTNTAIETETNTHTTNNLKTTSTETHPNSETLSKTEKTLHH
ncbi:MAG: cell division protein ZapA [Gammaproteobacteria bacterium]